MSINIGNDWDEILNDEWQKPYYRKLRELLIEEYRHYDVYPPATAIFRALQLVPYAACKVVILGQDPYHEPRQANGLAFSVSAGVPVPPSLRNIYEELQNDLGISPVAHGDLTAWAKQGVLLLNATLTVRAHLANSHEAIGWRLVTDRIIRELGSRKKPLAFILWGKYAQSKRPLIENPAHLILQSPHPSPLSAHRGFFGSRPFSAINEWLVERDEEPIDWRLPEHPTDFIS